MGKVTVCLRVFFDQPFWIGIFERREDDYISVCRICFGSEPKDNELYAYILQTYSQLDFSPNVLVNEKPYHRSPKRKQKETKEAIEQIGVGTKSQQAMKLQQEQNKQQRNTLSRQQKQVKRELMYALKQQKRKAKHKGH